jgi:hypothetical protein
MPGVRVTSVRRTVRVAVVLVAGQALLCGIIGFVTFGGHDAAPRPRLTAPQLAAPPIVVPTPSPGPASELARGATPGSVRLTRAGWPTSPPTSAAVRRPTRTISPSVTVTVPAAPAPPPVPSGTPTDRSLLSPPTSGGPVEDAPVPVAGEPCDDEGATGRTADGKAVRCERDRDGGLRWTLVQ